MHKSGHTHTYINTHKYTDKYTNKHTHARASTHTHKHTHVTRNTILHKRIYTYKGHVGSITINRLSPPNTNVACYSVLSENEEKFLERESGNRISSIEAIVLIEIWAFDS